MSEQQFRQASGSLAFSQNLRDQMMQQQMPQDTQQNTMQDSLQDQQPQSIQQEAPQQEQQSVIQTIKDTLSPFMDKITSLLTKQEDEPKEAVLKVEGTMEPKPSE